MFYSRKDEENPRKNENQKKRLPHKMNLCSKLKLGHSSTSRSPSTHLGHRHHIRYLLRPLITYSTDPQPLPVHVGRLLHTIPVVSLVMIFYHPIQPTRSIVSTLPQKSVIPSEPYQGQDSQIRTASQPLTSPLSNTSHTL